MATDIKPPAAFTINRRIWLRGEGEDVSYLLRPGDAKQCCVGIFLEACGVSRCDLDGTTTAADLEPPKDSRLGWLWRTVDASTAEDIPVNKLYRTNDDASLSPAEREQAITQTFADHGVTVNFIDDEEENQS